MHGDLEAATIDVHHDVVVVHFLTLKRIILGAFNGIRVRSRAASHEVGDAAMLVAFVVVDVSGKNDEPRALVLLPGFQHFRQLLLLRAG